MVQDPAWRAPIAISLGAIGGALSRYYLTTWFTAQFGVLFPYGTFFINLTGCLAMGFFIPFALHPLHPLPPEVRLLVATGFLGAYTTFSTYGLDSLNLVNSQNYRFALVYWLGSALLGVFCVQVGTMGAKFFLR